MFLSPPCGSTEAWTRVVTRLDRDGDVATVSVQLPSCEPGSEARDVDVLHDQLDQATGPVVLVAHSNGGLPLSEVGGHPVVAELVYVDAVMWDVGEPWPRLLDDGVAEDFAACHRVTGALAEFDTEALATYLLGRGWPAHDVEEFMPGFRPERHATTVTRLTTAAWREKPSTFIAPHDSELKRYVQDRFARRATRVVEIEGDHFPHWRRPDEIARLLLHIAREKAS
jgi:pimeloyl-ACP methyl ester carboxylesterase